MGLNLTRQDYERARAGVSAFLKAQRVDNASPNPGGEGSGSNTADAQSAITDNGPGSAKMSSQSKLANRSTSSPMLSFFTAVVPTEEDDAKARPSLDDVGALEEKRRRKERRRRLKEKRERQGEDFDKTGSTLNHVKEPSITSTTLDGSPLTVLSIDTNGDYVPAAIRSVVSKESWQGRVGLGLQMGEDVIDSANRPAQMQSPKQLAKQMSMTFQSPGLLKMSSKAHIDSDGRLTLMATPDHRQRREEMLAEEDIVAMTNTGAETDDSGVFLVTDPLKKESICHRRQSSTDVSPLIDLHESLDRMSFLDRVMAQKRSPIRLRKEAKAREREARKNARQADLVVMTATTTAQPVAQSALQPLPRRRDSAVDAQQTKSVRWAHHSSSPRQRMTTKEHYDYAFYGIAPNPADMASNIPTFYDDEMKRNGAESGLEDQSFYVRQRTVSNWMKPHLGQGNMGSPMAVRNHGMLAQDSPGVLSLGLEGMGDRIDAPNMSAKRGLLFGPSSNTDRTSPAMTGPDPMDAAGLFSQGPTLARSPARNVFDSYTLSTPTGMTRSVTALAAPFSFHQAGVEGDRFKNGAEESPDRVMLMRAHSSGALERRKAGHLRQTSLLAKEIGKDSPDLSEQSKRAPAGWFHHSPIGRSSDTISPAAIFGMTSSQQRIRVFSGEIHEMGRLPLEPTKGRSGHNGQQGHSDEEGDDERELDGSPGMNGGNAGHRYRPHFAKNHTRDSSASTSIFEGSPMYLDTNNRTAQIVNTLPSSSTLINALGLTGEDGNIKGSSQSSSKSKKKKKAQEVQQQAQSSMDVNLNKSISSQDLHSAAGTNSMSTYGRMEWDKADGTRVVKLISEELQAALESGTLTVEPPARYYKLPPDWGQSKSKPLSVSYAGMIGQALLSSSDGRLSLNEIYNWISTVFPFFERGDRGWQNSIRHNLSLNKSFIKVEREAHIPGKGGWWAIKQGHEDRFRAGSYIAPGSALSQKVGPKTPKASINAANKEDEWTPPQPEEGAEGEAQMLRRKRQESDGRSETAYENASDSDYHPTSQVAKPGKKTKKVKLVGGTTKKGRSSLAAEGKQSSLVPLQKRVPLHPVQSSSPQDASFDSITPHRTHQFTTSSGHGSTSTTSMMAGMPMLTDASSPPSSPNNNFDGLMPPPSGGIQGAASSHSARKRRQSVSRAVDMMNSGLMQHQSAFVSQNGSLSSNAMGYNHLSSHTLQASPLAHMRASNGNNINGSAMITNARLRAGPGHSLITAMDSPLRRHSNNNIHGSPIDNSPSRLFVNSPISSMRGLHDSSSMSMERSTTGADLDGDKENQIPDIQRGSPSRLSSQFAPVQQQHSFQSPAGLHMQMALGPGNPNGAGSQFLSYGGGNTPTRYTDQNNGNFIYQRWGLSPSPGKPIRFSANTPNMYPQTGALVPQGHGSGSNGLEDPFDYSGNLQHELDMTAGLAQYDGVSESPMKMAYPQVVRNQFFNGQQVQQQPLQPSQHQQQIHYLPNGSYSTTTASQVFGYRDVNEH
jgi:hypothetical protein